MKGRKKAVIQPVREVKDSYKVKKAVMNNIPMSDVDMEGGFAWAALIPVLKALGLPILGAAGSWLGKKIFGPKEAKAAAIPPGYVKDPAGPEGSGIMRAGDKRRGKGIMRAGRGGGIKAHIVEAGDMPIMIPQHSRNGKATRAGDLPLPTKYVDIVGAGIDIEKLRVKLIPFIKANDPEGFKNKIMKTIKKKALGSPI